MVDYKYVKRARDKWNDLLAPKGHDSSILQILLLFIIPFIALTVMIATLPVAKSVLILVICTGIWLVSSKLYPYWFLDRHRMKLRSGVYIYPEWVFENISYYIRERCRLWTCNGNDLTEDERNFLREIDNQCISFKGDSKDYRQFLTENKKALIECLYICKKRFDK